MSQYISPSNPLQQIHYKKYQFALNTIYTSLSSKITFFYFLIDKGENHNSTYESLLQ